jgi:hypothetical protein
MKGVVKSSLDKTEGNSFFMEEIVQALVGQGMLARDAGEW